MYTKEQLMGDLAALAIDPRGTLLVHSSMKAIGPVAGGADTVLDALSAYMAQGLLVLPTHTWRQMNASYTVMDVRKEPSCVGILPTLFMRRPGVVRSLHPTHSVAALGKEAGAYIAGEENSRTPCARAGCWGKLLDRGAQILFLGCSLKCNTFLHGVEEWNGIPLRLSPTLQEFTVIDAHGQRHATPQYRHDDSASGVEPSQFYDKMEPLFRKGGAIRYGAFGDARCILGDAVKMDQITSAQLQKNPRLFDNGDPIMEEE